MNPTCIKRQDCSFAIKDIILNLTFVTFLPFLLDFHYNVHQSKINVSKYNQLNEIL